MLAQSPSAAQVILQAPFAQAYTPQVCVPTTMHWPVVHDWNWMVPMSAHVSLQGTLQQMPETQWVEAQSPSAWQAVPLGPGCLHCWPAHTYVAAQSAFVVQLVPHAAPLHW